MPKFSAASLLQRKTLHLNLQKVADHVVAGWDCTLLEGKRSEEQQKINVARGTSWTMDSKHVYPLDKPSLAMDIAPYPVKWPNPKLPTYPKDLALWYAFGGYVMGVADGLGIKLRWGADWDGDQIINDQIHDDLPHFELL